jgi:hypothetical protein
MSMSSPILSIDHQQKLENLKELLDFGHKAFKNLQVDWVRIKRRKKTLLRMATAIHAHTEGGYTLLSAGNIHSAEVLLRPILETLINAEYILCGRSNETLNRFLTMSNTTLIKKLYTMLKFISDNPDTKVSLTNVQLLEAIKSRQDENKEFAKLFKYKFETAEIAVADRVTRIDREYKRLKKPQAFSKYWRYLTEYTLLSDNVHLSNHGLRYYMKDSPTRVDLVFGGNLDVVGHLVDGFYVHYTEMLRIMSVQLNLVSLSEIKAYERKYKIED